MPIGTDIDVSVREVENGRRSFSPFGGWTSVCESYVLRAAIVGVFLLCTARLRATTVIIISTESGFVVAADSGVSGGKGEARARLDCKMFEANSRFIWGITGLRRMPGFDARTMLQPLMTNTDLRELKGTISETITPQLTEQAKRLRELDPNKFQRLIESDDAIFGFFLANDHYAVIQDYKVTITASNRVAVTARRPFECELGTSCPAGRLMMSGHHGEIDRFWASHAMAATEIRSDADLARFLVGLEVDSNPQVVARPIDVVEITGRGVRWINEKAECIEQSETKASH